MDRDRQDVRDDAELKAFGYAPQLDRTMGAFSSFAVSFSLISITTGIFANFGYGLRHVGPSLLWSWTIAVLGQLLVALVIADLSTRFPLSGYGYQWACRLVNPHFGFFVGWMLLLQYLVGFPAICHALATEVHGYVFPPDQAPIPVAAITLGVIGVVALIHLFGLRLAAFVNDIGVITEIAGTAAITVILLVGSLWFWNASLSIFTHSTNQEGLPADWRGWALSLLTGAWCITGFEGAADLAEETHQPKETVPKAVILSEVSSGVGGFLFLAAFILSIDQLSAAQASPTPMQDVIARRLGSAPTLLLMLVVFASIFACGMASMAALTRLLFAMARDNMLPASAALKLVHPRHLTPRNAIIVSWVGSSAVILGSEILRRYNQFDTMKVITSVATISAYLGYLGIVVSSLFARATLSTSAFQLGAARWVVAAGAIAWTVLVVGALTIPDSPDSGDQRLPLYVALGLVALGTAIYAFVIRRRLNAGAAGPPIVNSGLTLPHPGDHA